MRKSMIVLFLALVSSVLLTSDNSFASNGLNSPMDVTVKNMQPGQPYIEVRTENEGANAIVSFRLRHFQEDEVQVIGPQEWYSLTDIEDLQSAEGLRDVAGSSLAVLGISAVGGFAAGVGFAAATGGTNAAIAAGIAVMKAVGPVAAGATLFINNLNPYVQFREMRALRDDLIYDRDIEVNSEEAVVKMAETLDFLLERRFSN